MFKDRKHVTVDRGAELAGVSRRTMYYRMLAGRVEWFRTTSGSRRIYVDTLREPPKNKEAPNEHT